MKLTVDCELSHQLSALPPDSALACLLSKADRKWVDLPLEAVVCHQCGLQQSTDYPVAAVSANADGLQVGNDYWLRAAPVHLILQRDSFSLGEPVPLSVGRTQANDLLASLNLHFGADGLHFCSGESGNWYLRLEKSPQIKTVLPSVAIGKNMFQFLPQGEVAAKWGAYLNEVQMLLHTHQVNSVRESAGEATVNSLWLSGGGAMPIALSLRSDIDLIVADSPFYYGLAQLMRLPSQNAALDLESLLDATAGYHHARMQITRQDMLTDNSFQVLWKVLRAGKISVLTLNLGCYEKTLSATVTRLDFFKFWRKLKPVMQFLDEFHD